jgi:hypothetical protein
VEHLGGALERPRIQWRRTTKNEEPRRSVADAEGDEKHYRDRGKEAPRRRNESTADDRSNGKSRGRKKDGVSKRKNAVKDSFHPCSPLSLVVRLIIFNVLKEQQEVRDGKAMRRKRSNMKPMTMTSGKTEGMEAVRGTSKRKQQSTINSTSYLPCGERENRLMRRWMLEIHHRQPF